MYDGDCPICRMAAQALRIEKAAGSLHLIDARQQENHPLLIEIADHGLNLDEGMVIRIGGINYHGKDALQMMALIGGNQGWFNRLNAILFKSPKIASSLYPLMKLLRNLLLKIIGVPQLENLKPRSNLQPIFKDIFGACWPALPTVIQHHYAVREHSKDQVTVSGTLDIEVQKWVGLIAKFSGMLVPYSGKKVPVTVTFSVGPDGRSMDFDRIFNFPDKKTVRFRSTMKQLENGDVAEFMKFGFGWRFKFYWNGESVVLDHRGYLWRILGFHIPLPLSLILGKGYAEETPVSDTTFSMWTHTRHPLFGITFAYSGQFEVTDIKCNPS
ncbi:MAG: DUF4166 domain-containing protein [Sneathiella sp.]|nr:DUF4166 domain-containing protein [Sneathiella sp.]